MTTSLKIAFITAAAAGLLVGGVFGYREAKVASGAVQSAVTMSGHSPLHDFAREEFENADSAHARQAAQLEIKVLSEIEWDSRDRIAEQFLGLAYTRLALIEQIAGNLEARDAALQRAREWVAKARPGQNLTDEQLRNTLKMMDGAADRLQ